MASAALSSDHIHHEIIDGEDVAFEYPEELVKALPELTAKHGKLWTRLFAPAPHIVVFRTANAIEAQRHTAATLGDDHGMTVKETMRIGLSAIVWPSTEVVSKMESEAPALAQAVGFDAVGKAQGRFQRTGK